MIEDETRPTPTQLSSYLEQENAVLHERLRTLEIALEAERDACARIAERFTEPRSNTEPTELGRAIEAKIRVLTAKAIAALIRGRGEK